MPRISKSTKTVSKTRRSTAASDSWLEGEAAGSGRASTKTKPAAKKTVTKAKAKAKKPVAKKAVARKTTKVTKTRATCKPRQPKAVVAVKPMRTKLGRTELVEHLAEVAELDKPQVKRVLEALKAAMLSHIAPRGAGEFVMPGMFKVVTKKIPAKKVAAIKKGTEVRNPRTGETYAHEGRKAYTKPATVKVRIRPMKAMKDAAIGG